VDIDGTLISVSSEKLFVQHLVSRGLLGTAGFAGFLAGYLIHPVTTLRQGKGWNRRYLRYLDPDLVREEGRKFGASLFQKWKREEVVELVLGMKDAGSLIAIVSATLSFIAEGITSSMPVDILRASQPEESGGVLSGRLVSERPWGRGKVPVASSICMETGQSPESCMALGDSWADRHIMSLCGTPVAICPDRRLARLAGRKGWEILKGKHTRWA